MALPATWPQGPLQVCLEVLVIAHLLVHLEPVALAVGHNDLVGGRVEVHCGRRTEAPAAALSYAPGDTPSSCPDWHRRSAWPTSRTPAHHRPGWSAVCRCCLEDADAMIAPVGDVDVAVRINRHVCRVIEQACLRILMLRQTRDVPRSRIKSQRRRPATMEASHTCRCSSGSAPAATASARIHTWLVSIPFALSRAPQIAGRTSVQFLKRGIEPTDTAKSRCHRHLRHRQFRFIDQLLGEMHAPRLCYRDGCSSQMLQKHSAQMPRPEPQSLCQFVDAILIERALRDQLQSPRHTSRGAEPRRRAGRSLRTTPQTRPEPSFGRRGSGREVNDVRSLRRRRRTNRTAVYLRRRYCDKESPVKPGIPSQSGPIANRSCKFH